MVKYWNNHHGKPIKPSFLLEVMALECLAPPFGGRFDYEFQSMFATLADRIHDTWDDPAGLGPPVSDMMDASEKNGDALKAWRNLFGPRFPPS